MVGSDAEFVASAKIAGDMQIGGGNGMLPETDLHVMRVYSDATFRGFVDMRGDVTIGNNFNEDRLEIWSSTVVNNFAIQVRYSCFLPLADGLSRWASSSQTQPL